MTFCTSGCTTTATTSARLTQTSRPASGRTWAMPGSSRAVSSFPPHLLGRAGGGELRDRCSAGIAPDDGTARRRQLEVHAQVARVVEVGPQPALHRGGELAGDREAKADPARSGGARGVGAIETVKHPVGIRAVRSDGI